MENAQLFRMLGALCSPVSISRLLYRCMLGRDSSSSVYQRFGVSRQARGPGPVCWFHATTEDDCAQVLPLVFHAVEVYGASLQMVLTVSSARIQSLLADSLPSNVVVLLMPLDNPLSAEIFFCKWRPQIGVIMGSPFLPNLVLSAQKRGVKLALLSATLSASSVTRWGAHAPSRHFLDDVLQCFDLIIPASEQDVTRFYLMSALGSKVPGWSIDLQQAAVLGGGESLLQKPAAISVAQLRAALQDRCTWVAAGTLEGEESEIAEVHSIAAALLKGQQLLTILSPADHARCGEVEMLLRGKGLNVMRWGSSLNSATPMHTIDILLLDVPSDLPLMYSVSEVVYVGNSLTAACSGSSLSRAAVAGCAVLTGPHISATADRIAELNMAALAAAHKLDAPALCVNEAEVRKLREAMASRTGHRQEDNCSAAAVRGISHLQGSSSASNGNTWNTSRELLGTSRNTCLSPSGEVDSWDNLHTTAAAVDNAAEASTAAAVDKQQLEHTDEHQSKEIQDLQQSVASTIFPANFAQPCVPHVNAISSIKLPSFHHHHHQQQQQLEQHTRDKVASPDSALLMLQAADSSDLTSHTAALRLRTSPVGAPSTAAAQHPRPLQPASPCQESRAMVQMAILDKPTAVTHPFTISIPGAVAGSLPVFNASPRQARQQEQQLSNIFNPETRPVTQAQSLLRQFPPFGGLLQSELDLPFQAAAFGSSSGLWSSLDGSGLAIFENPDSCDDPGDPAGTALAFQVRRSLLLSLMADQRHQPGGLAAAFGSTSGPIHAQAPLEQQQLEYELEASSAASTVSETPLSANARRRVKVALFLTQEEDRRRNNSVSPRSEDSSGLVQGVLLDSPGSRPESALAITSLPLPSVGILATASHAEVSQAPVVATGPFSAGSPLLLPTNNINIAAAARSSSSGSGRDLLLSLTTQQPPPVFLSHESSTATTRQLQQARKQQAAVRSQRHGKATLRQAANQQSRSSQGVTISPLSSNGAVINGVGISTITESLSQSHSQPPVQTAPSFFPVSSMDAWLHSSLSYHTETRLRQASRLASATAAPHVPSAGQSFSAKDDFSGTTTIGFGVSHLSIPPSPRRSLSGHSRDMTLTQNPCMTTLSSKATSLQAAQGLEETAGWLAITGAPDDGTDQDPETAALLSALTSEPQECCLGDSPIAGVSLLGSPMLTVSSGGKTAYDWAAHSPMLTYQGTTDSAGTPNTLISASASGPVAQPSASTTGYAAQLLDVEVSAVFKTSETCPEDLDCPVTPTSALASQNHNPFQLGLHMQPPSPTRSHQSRTPGSCWPNAVGTGSPPSTPSTPTSRVSKLHESPFAGAAFDRPCPFSITDMGQHVNLKPLPPACSRFKTAIHDAALELDTVSGHSSAPHIATQQVFQRQPPTQQQHEEDWSQSQCSTTDLDRWADSLGAPHATLQANAAASATAAAAATISPYASPGVTSRVASYAPSPAGSYSRPRHSRQPSNSSIAPSSNASRPLLPTHSNMAAALMHRNHHRHHDNSPHKPGPPSRATSDLEGAVYDASVCPATPKSSKAHSHSSPFSMTYQSAPTVAELEILYQDSPPKTPKSSRAHAHTSPFTCSPKQQANENDHLPVTGKLRTQSSLSYPREPLSTQNRDTEMLPPCFKALSTDAALELQVVSLEGSFSGSTHNSDATSQATTVVAFAAYHSQDISCQHSQASGEDTSIADSMTALKVDQPASHVQDESHSFSADPSGTSDQSEPSCLPQPTTSLMSSLTTDFPSASYRPLVPAAAAAAAAGPPQLRRINQSSQVVRCASLADGIQDLCSSSAHALASRGPSLHEDHATCEQTFILPCTTTSPFNTSFPLSVASVTASPPKTAYPLSIAPLPATLQISTDSSSGFLASVPDCASPITGSVLLTLSPGFRRHFSNGIGAMSVVAGILDSSAALFSESAVRLNSGESWGLSSVDSRQLDGTDSATARGAAGGPGSRLLNRGSMDRAGSLASWASILQQIDLKSMSQTPPHISPGSATHSPVSTVPSVSQSLGETISFGPTVSDIQIVSLGTGVYSPTQLHAAATSLSTPAGSSALQLLQFAERPLPQHTTGCHASPNGTQQQQQRPLLLQRQPSPFHVNMQPAHNNTSASLDHCFIQNVVSCQQATSCPGDPLSSSLDVLHGVGCTTGSMLYGSSNPQGMQDILPCVSPLSPLRLRRPSLDERLAPSPPPLSPNSLSAYRSTSQPPDSLRRISGHQPWMSPAAPPQHTHLLCPASFPPASTELDMGSQTFSATSPRASSNPQHTSNPPLTTPYTSSTQLGQPLTASQWEAQQPPLSTTQWDQDQHRTLSTSELLANTLSLICGPTASITCHPHPYLSPPSSKHTSSSQIVMSPRSPSLSISAPSPFRSPHHSSVVPSTPRACHSPFSGSQRDPRSVPASPFSPAPSQSATTPHKQRPLHSSSPHVRNSSSSYSTEPSTPRAGPARSPGVQGDSPSSPARDPRILSVPSTPRGHRTPPSPGQHGTPPSRRAFNVVPWPLPQQQQQQQPTHNHDQQQQLQSPRHQVPLQAILPPFPTAHTIYNTDLHTTTVPPYHQPHAAHPLPSLFQTSNQNENRSVPSTSVSTAKQIAVTIQPLAELQHPSRRESSFTFSPVKPATRNSPHKRSHSSPSGTRTAASYDSYHRDESQPPMSESTLTRHSAPAGSIRSGERGQQMPWQLHCIDEHHPLSLDLMLASGSNGHDDHTVHGENFAGSEQWEQPECSSGMAAADAGTSGPERIQHDHEQAHDITPSAIQPAPSHGMHYTRVVKPAQLTQSAVGRSHGIVSHGSSTADAGTATSVSLSASSMATNAAACGSDHTTSLQHHQPRGVKRSAAGSMRYPGVSLLTATQLLHALPSEGPAVWQVSGVRELSTALVKLLSDPLERRSRGHAAATAAAYMADILVGSVWAELDRAVVGPALKGFQIS